MFGSVRACDEAGDGMYVRLECKFSQRTGLPLRREWIEDDGNVSMDQRE